MDLNSIRNRILAERKKIGLTQDEMGQRLGISGNAYRDIENGKTSLISKRLLDISEILEISPEELIVGYNIPAEDFKNKLNEAEKEFNKRIAEIENNHRLEMMEKDGEINILKTTLLSKDKIIGLLKENKSDY